MLTGRDYHDAMLFKKLTPMEVKEFQQYARENDPLNIERWYIYHPVCRQVWLERGIVPLENDSADIAREDKRNAS